MNTKTIITLIATAILGVGLLSLVPAHAQGFSDNPQVTATIPFGTNLVVGTTPFIWTNPVTTVYESISVLTGATVFGAESYSNQTVTCVQTNIGSGSISNIIVCTTNQVLVGYPLTVANATFFINAGGVPYNSNPALGLYGNTGTNASTVSLVCSNGGTAQVFINGGKR